ncbi:hypothetical protein SK128_005948 [Halocaridina rubra]|uniref:Uncharacterized protein n=1 Tax=Halocaridina rubra TaxID=373956 RepID=A0AAN8XS19_HALRR
MSMARQVSDPPCLRHLEDHLVLAAIVTIDKRWISPPATGGGSHIDSVTVPSPEKGKGMGHNTLSQNKAASSIGTIKSDPI